MAPRFWRNGLFMECELKNFINGIGDFVVYVNVKKLMARYRDINAHGLSWLTTRRLNNDSGSCMTATGIINNIAIFRVTDFSSRDYSSNSRGEPDLNVALFSWVLEWNKQPRSLMYDLGFFRIMDYWSTYTNILLRRGTVPPKRICSLVEFLRVAKPRWTYFVQIFLPLLYRRGFCIDGKITYMLQQVVYTKHSLEQISGRGFAYFTVVNCKLYFKHPAVLNKQLIATYELTLDKTADRFKVHHLLEQLNEGRSRCRYNDMNGSEKPGIYTKYEKLFQQTILEEYQQIEFKYDLTPTQACLRLVSEAPPHWANGLLQECELKNFVNGIADFVLYVNVAKLRAQYGDADENAFSWLTTRALNNDTGVCTTATDLSSREYDANINGKVFERRFLYFTVKGCLFLHEQPSQISKELLATYELILDKKAGRVEVHRLLELFNGGKPGCTYNAFPFAYFG
ncbi:hypothetical protein X801_01432, partial [Opisthorchis viverrini]